MVGHSALQRAYQVRVPGANSLALLQQAASRLEVSTLIEGVSLNPLVENQHHLNTDPVADRDTANTRNWPFRAIDAYGAWASVYDGVSDEQLQQIPIGIVDAWFEPLEPDWVFRTNVTADFGIVTGNFGPS